MPGSWEALTLPKAVEEVRLISRIYGGSLCTCDVECCISCPTQSSKGTRCHHPLSRSASLSIFRVIEYFFPGLFFLLVHVFVLCVFVSSVWVWVLLSLVGAKLPCEFCQVGLRSKHLSRARSGQGIWNTLDVQFLGDFDTRSLSKSSWMKPCPLMSQLWRQMLCCSCSRRLGWMILKVLLLLGGQMANVWSASERFLVPKMILFWWILWFWCMLQLPWSLYGIWHLFAFSSMKGTGLCQVSGSMCHESWCKLV